MTLYLKTRPQTLSELDLQSVRESLQKIVLSGSIPHALLFAGPKGTGKTSAARILAKIINCARPSAKGEPCNRCPQCLSITKGQNIDVIELDAASNRGIDDIRLLRESVLLAPARAKKKLYIIDEAHMLTTEAANAFLKTLEEPPAHVIFILATTDPQKLPATIRSRLTTVTFHQATPAEIKRQLTRVIHAEKLSVTDSALALITENAEGSFRDAVKILEALSFQSKKITAEAVQTFLSRTPSEDVESFLALLARADSVPALRVIQSLISRGSAIKQFTDDLIARLRLALLAAAGLEGQPLEGFDKQSLIKLIQLLITARSQIARSPFPELSLELAVIKWCARSPSRVSPVSATPAPPPPAVSSKTNHHAASSFDSQCWTKILSEVRLKNTTIEALLRSAEPLNYDGECLSVGVYYRFHKERLEVNQNRLTLEEVAAQILGSPVRVRYQLTERSKPLPPKKDPPLTASQDNDIIQAAKEIFGE